MRVASASRGRRIALFAALAAVAGCATPLERPTNGDDAGGADAAADGHAALRDGGNGTASSDPPSSDGSPADGGQITDSGRASALNAPDTYVQLFKWRWTNIATECTRFLGPNGFGAVQISPAQASNAHDAWWNMYQPVSDQNLTSNMGNATELATMIATCHAAGVRIYADVVFNHMAGGAGIATDGSSYDSDNLQYPAFGESDFHSPCAIQPGDYDTNRDRVVSCRLDGMPDLATDTPAVRSKLAQSMTSLVHLGIDGFRIDAAKHLWPADIAAILGQVPKVTSMGEPIFITQEIVPDATVNRGDYFVNGTINEFRFTYAVRDAFRSTNGGNVATLTSAIGTGNGGGTANLAPSPNVTVFVDNHDTERSRSDSLNLYDDGDGRFVLANVFMLAQGYGRAQLQSGFVFSFASTDQNAPAASPYDASGNAVVMGAWDMVHRWPSLYPVVAFRSATAGEPMTHVRAEPNRLAFARGAKGFVALNNDEAPWTGSFETGLPPGTYCNVVHGLRADTRTSCSSDSVTVDGTGNAVLDVPALGSAEAPAVVLHIGQRTN